MKNFFTGAGMTSWLQIFIWLLKMLVLFASPIILVNLFGTSLFLWLYIPMIGLAVYYTYADAAEK